MSEYENKSHLNKEKQSSKKVTMKMIAEKAGVSVSCVTRCINDSGYVAEKKKKAVQSVMEELRYVPNRHARILRGEESKLLAYIYLSADENIFFTKIAVRRHAVVGANRTLISVKSPTRSCCTGSCRRFPAALPHIVVALFEKQDACF